MEEDLGNKVAESNRTFQKPAEPADSSRTEFDILVSSAPVHAWRDQLIQAGYLVARDGQSAGLMTLALRPHDLLETTPGQPLRRHQYPEDFFERHILSGRTKLSPDRAANYLLETHSMHAYCLESSRTAPLAATFFPEIKDPVVLNLVAGFLVTSREAPSLDSFNRCFRRPIEGITQERIDAAYAVIQDTRPARGFILQNALATTCSARRRSMNEVAEMRDPVFDPHLDRGDRFNVQHVLERGITVTVKREVLEDALPTAPRQDVCPHAEHLKSQKLFAVAVDDRPLSDGSKLALSAHDTFDHMFFFDLAHKTMLADALLPTIANFNFSTRDNIFSLASEYIAMVAYDWRAWQEVGMSHNRPVEPILKGARETLQAGLDAEQIPLIARRHVEALLALPDEHPLAQQFGFVLRGIMWENGEMAIKWGPLDLKPLETTSERIPEPWGPTPILEHAGYLAFVICGLEQLNDASNGALQVLQKINYTLEHQLMEAIRHYESHETPYQFALDIRQLRTEPPVEVPQRIQDWFNKHIGFAAVRAPLCD